MKYNEGPRDEYEMYIPSIFGLKINGANAEEIALKLNAIESQRMDIGGGYENCKKVAEKILNLNY